MYESLLAVDIKKLDIDFLGEVAEVDFITASALTTLVGMDGVGQLTNASVDWLKYKYLGKTVYLAKKVIRHGMTWESMDALSITKGTKQFTIGGLKYTLRLPTGYATPPTSTYDISEGGSFNDLIYPVYGGVGLDAVQVQRYSRLASYSDADLGLYTDKYTVSGTPGSMTWCQDLIASGDSHMARGYNDLDNAGKYQLLAGWYIGLGGAQAYAGWRPIVELMDPQPPVEDTGDVVFLYDPVTNTDLAGNPSVSTLSGGAVADATILINGQPTLKFPTGSARQVIAFPSDLNLSTGNWTLEWSFINNSAPTGYANDFVMYSRTGGSSVGVYTRFGDSGFGHRYNLSDPRGAANPALTQALPYTKTSLIGLTTNVALVSIAGVIKVYINGVAQLMALGAGGGTYNLPTFTAQGMDAIYQWGIGWVGSTVQAVPGNRGRIRLSNFARYRNNYTPGPLTM